MLFHFCLCRDVFAVQQHPWLLLCVTRKNNYSWSWWRRGTYCYRRKCMFFFGWALNNPLDDTQKKNIRAHWCWLMSTVCWLMLLNICCLSVQCCRQSLFIYTSPFLCSLSVLYALSFYFFCSFCSFYSFCFFCSISSLCSICSFYTLCFCYPIFLFQAFYSNLSVF